MAKKGAALRAARRQAQAEAAVKYDPTQRVLLDALGTARQEEVRAVNSAKGTSSALSAAIRGARRPLARGYTDAARTASAARGDLLGHLASLGAPAAPFSAAVAREQAGVTSRTAQERANALGELTLRGVQAKEGRASSIQNAHQTYATDAGSIYRQLVGTAQDRGTFTAAQIGDIRQAQRTVSAENARARLTARTSAANNRRTNRTSRQNTQARVRQSNVNSQRTAASKRTAAAAAKHKPLSDAQSQHLVERIGAARGWIQRVSSLYPGKSSTQIRELLASGGRIQTGTAQSTTASGKTTSHATYETIPAFGDPRVINSAYDLHVFHALSPANQRALRRVRLPSAWKQWRHPAGTRVLPDVQAAARSGHAR